MINNISSITKVFTEGIQFLNMNNVKKLLEKEHMIIKEATKMALALS